jgi:hypothetical protein
MGYGEYVVTTSNKDLTNHLRRPDHNVVAFKFRGYVSGVEDTIEKALE